MRYRSMNILSAMLVLALASANAGAAQESASKGPSISAQLVKTGIYVFGGGGGNSVLRLSANGLILVNSKLPGSYGELARKIRKISDQPVRALILTDYLAHHTGNDASFVEAGARIVAQENIARNLIDRSTLGKSAITFGRDYRVQLGGVEVQIFSFGSAHTSGDSVVYFPNQKVVAVGDLYALPPVPDYSSGGSLRGWASVLGRVLELDFDVAVPSAGPPVSRAEVAALKSRIDALVSRGTVIVRREGSRGEAISELKAEAAGLQFSFTDNQLACLFGELSGAR